MKAKLRAVGFNELLGFAARFIFQLQILILSHLHAALVVAEKFNQVAEIRLLVVI